ncbi:AraC family ligand binding domain-containing protein [Paenibacillus rhizoplanae]
MTYPKELKEYPRLEEKTYPFRLFFNTCREVAPEQNILFLHWHEHFEIIIMREGQAIFHVDSKPYEAGPGDVLMVPSGGLHVGYSQCSGDLSYVSIVFHATLFKDRNQDSQHEQFVAPYLNNLNQFPVMPAAQQPECAAYYHLLERVIAEVEAKQPAFSTRGQESAAPVLHPDVPGLPGPAAQRAGAQRTPFHPPGALQAAAGTPGEPRRSEDVD